MMSLFSVFDPVSGGLQVNWLAVVIPLCVVGYNKYFVEGIVSGFVNFIFKSVMLFFKQLSMPNGRGVILLVVSVFFYLAIQNVLGLFPFIFTATAHPLITLGLGLVMWMMCFMMGWSKKVVFSAGHLVPEGSPLFLSFFLVLVESVSHLIRPFTLSIRLAANMMAGHLIVGLISSISMLGLGGLISSVLLQGLLMVLELGVAIIQAVVFSILLLLYVVEYY